MFVDGLTNRVCGGLLALLVEAVMSGDGAVGGLSLYGLTIRADQHACHHTQGPVAWTENTEFINL